MTLEKLSSLKGSSPASTQGTRRRRVPALLLPIALLLAFVAVFALMFGPRLVPALQVQTAPVITLRTAQQSPTAAQPPSSPQSPIPNNPITTPLLFQSSGWVEPDPYITNVSTLINGVIDEVSVLEGETVKKNQLLATLIDDDALLDVQEATRKVETLNATQIAHCAALPVLNAEMNTADKNIAAAQAHLDELQDAADRLTSLPKGAVPALDVAKALTQLQRQQATLEAAKAEFPRLLAEINKVDLERLAVDARIKEAETDLARKELAFDRTRISSPMDGIVLHLHAAPGKKRMLDMDDAKSAVIVELYDPGKLQARIDVPLTEAASLGVGQPVKITTDLLPDVKFDGEVTRIVGEADLQRNTLQCKVRIINPDPRLRPEMLVRAEFYPAAQAAPPNSQSPDPQPTAGDRLTIYAPKAALFDLTNTSARAWIVDNNRAQLREVQLAPGERDNHRPVLSGLRPGDKLILPPHTKLKPNKRVKVTQ